MSLHVLADHMASKGRNGDSMLVHMTPGEVAGLHALAAKHGGELTINPDTGLPEANFLKKLLPTIIGAGISYFSGGTIDPMTAAAMVGGAETVRTGSLERGLMAGMGAYGGAGLTAGFMGAGSAGLAGEAATLAGQQATEQGLTEAARSQAIDEAVRAQGFNEAVGKTAASEVFSKGAAAAAANPLDFAKANWKPLAAAASPILADMMVPTTTKMPTDTTPAYIRQKLYDPYTQTYKSLAPVKATDWGSRNFSDAYTNPQTGEMATLQPRTSGMATGGIVALAAGGRGTDVAMDADATTPAPMSINDLYKQVLGRDVESEGAAGYWQNQFGSTIDPTEIEAFRTAAAPELAARVAPAGVASLPNTTVAAPANAGLAALNTSAAAAAAPAGMSLSAAQADVADIYRNVLGRDVDPTGLNYWSQKFATSSDPNAVYNELLASAKTNTEMIRADAPTTFADAAKDYAGYMSTDTGNIVDEWVRNTLGREPTAADRQQQWYKDAADKMTTQGQAQDLYGQFKTYATKESSTEIANRVRAIDAELKAKGLTDADLFKQTGKTKQQLATEGLNLDLNWMGASQLAPAAQRKAFDLTAVKNLTPLSNTFGGPAIDRTITNPYGNATNPGDLTYNRDGSVTVTPNIPYRPYGGFSGMDEVKNAYTQGGGSLGYTSPVVQTAAEHEARYNRQTSDSLAAYNYLMGKGANPVESQAATSPTGIMRPYFTGGKKYTPRFLTANASGVVTSSTTNPNAPAASTTPSAQSINVKTPSGAVVTAFLGSDGTYRTVDGAKYDVTGNPIVAEAADGGLMGYSVGGGLGSLGSYSDGGRLLKGPGDGVSDSIPATIGAKKQPARLADGEFVVPARIVSELGNGSTDAGAKKLYAMMDRVQKARGKTTGKNKVAANSRADKYLPA